ncbi:MAG: hypothetical protein E6Z04_09510 [Cutibacterium avidum]|nr:hypothetical protein [Cutibacterium avidum]
MSTLPFLFDGRCLVLVIAMAAVIVIAKLRDDADRADWCTHCDGTTSTTTNPCPHCHGTGIEPGADA